MPGIGLNLGSPHPYGGPEGRSSHYPETAAVWFPGGRLRPSLEAPFKMSQPRLVSPFTCFARARVSPRLLATQRAPISMATRSTYGNLAGPSITPPFALLIPPVVVVVVPAP